MNNFTIKSSLAYDGFDPLPENLRGWHGNDPLFAELIEEVQPKLIIEVGSWLGQSAINMAQIVKRLQLDCKIICVDTWLGALEFIDKAEGTDWDLMRKNGYPQVYYQFLSNVVHHGCQDIIIPFPQTSLIAARYFKAAGVSADLIYIDGSHDYDDVLNDLNAYWPLLNDKGIIFGDDFDRNCWPDVVEAVYTFSQLVDYDGAVEDNNNFWWIKRNKEWEHDYP